MATEVKVVDREYLLKQFQNYNTKIVQKGLQNLEDKKMDKVEGYGLSKNDFTDAYKQKLDALDSDLSERVASVEGTLETLQGDISTEGSIAKMTADAVAQIVSGAPDDFDTLKEISDWISGHAEDAAGMNSQINQNKTDIATLREDLDNIDITVETSDIDFDDLYGTNTPTPPETDPENPDDTGDGDDSAGDEDEEEKTVEISGEAEVNVGETITLTSNAANTVWESDDDEVATVENGVVTGVAEGTAVITATAEGYKPGTKSIQVKVVTTTDPEDEEQEEESAEEPNA